MDSQVKVQIQDASTSDAEQDTKVFKSKLKYAHLSKNMQKYSKVCKSEQKYTQLCKRMQKYLKVQETKTKKYI